MILEVIFKFIFIENSILYNEIINLSLNLIFIAKIQNYYNKLLFEDFFNSSFYLVQFKSI